MPAFPKPAFPYALDFGRELQRLRDHRETRRVPAKRPDRLLAASWNVANLGAQQRDNAHVLLVAEVLSWFDLTAVQECRENFADLERVVHELPAGYRMLVSDSAGNDERMAFVYDAGKLGLLEEIGEIAFEPRLLRSIRLPGVTQAFEGFDRTPYLASFRFAGTSFTFVNVHLYYGSERAEHVQRRALETFAVAKWADRRSRSPYSFTRELVALGDFNMPKREPGDPIFKALTRLGLEVPEHSSQVGSAIASDSHYDQIALLPGTSRRCLAGGVGVFDYDAVVFADLWDDGRRRKDFLAYCRYYVSDHRPIWVQLQAPGE